MPTDCSDLAPALYEADEAILVPRITEPDIWSGSFRSAGKRKLRVYFP